MLKFNFVAVLDLHQMTKTVAYKKQKRVYLLLNNLRVTVKVFPNLAAIVSHVNELVVRGLDDQLVYGRVAWAVSESGEFSFKVRGLERFISVMFIEGSFRGSRKRGIVEDQLGSLVVSEAQKFRFDKGEFSSVFSPAGNWWDLWDSGFHRGKKYSREEASKWVCDSFEADLIDRGRIG